MSEPKQKLLPVDAWTPVFVQDELSGASTFVMNNRQYGAFCRLRWHAWKQQASLPDDRRLLAKYADEDREWFDTPEGAAVLAEYPVGPDGRRRNATQAEHYRKAKKNREDAQERAKNAANARWNRGGSDDPGGMPPDSSGNAGASNTDADASKSGAGAVLEVCPPPSSSPSPEKAVVEAALAAALERYPIVVAWIGDDSARRLNVADGADHVAQADGERAVLGYVATLQRTIQEYDPKVVEQGLMNWLTRAKNHTPSALLTFVAGAMRTDRQVAEISSAPAKKSPTPSRPAENRGPTKLSIA